MLNPTGICENKIISVKVKAVDNVLLQWIPMILVAPIHARFMQKQAYINGIN